VKTWYQNKLNYILLSFIVFYLQMNMHTCNSTAGGITAKPTSKSAAAKLDTKQLVTDRNLLVVITAAITRVLPTYNNKKRSQSLKI